MGEAKDTEADEDDLSGRAQADCGGAESTVGEGKAHRVTPADSGSMRPDHLPRWASGPPLLDVRGITTIGDGGYYLRLNRQLVFRIAWVDLFKAAQKPVRGELCKCMNLREAKSESLMPENMSLGKYYLNEPAPGLFTLSKKRAEFPGPKARPPLDTVSTAKRRILPWPASLGCAKRFSWYSPVSVFTEAISWYAG
jgi:hypothetical protein